MPLHRPRSGARKIARRRAHHHSPQHYQSTWGSDPPDAGSLADGAPEICPGIRLEQINFR
jgi:hypothetical protein